MRGLPLAEYVAQMYCNANDTAKGRQMCNHFQHKASHYPSWSSVIGTQIPQGVGAAFASRRRGEDAVHAIYFGDGATSSNGFHSGLNFAGVWRVPCVFVCLDNGWAISVPFAPADRLRVPGRQGRWPTACRAKRSTATTCWPASRRVQTAVSARARGARAVAASCSSPTACWGTRAPTIRRKYRQAEEVAAWAARDPIARFERYLVGRGVLREGERAEIEQQLLAEIDARHPRAGSRARRCRSRRWSRTSTPTSRAT